MTDIHEIAHDVDAAAREQAVPAAVHDEDEKLPPHLIPKDGCITFTRREADGILFASDVRDMIGRDWNPDALKDAIAQANKAGIRTQDLNLRGQDWKRRNLRDMDFRHCDLRYISWSGTDIRDVLFNHAKLDGSNFSGAIAQGADFRYASLKQTTFDGVVASALDGVQLWGQLDAGYQLYSYLVYGEPGTPEASLNPLMIIRAGCRAFTMKQALHHWTHDSERPGILLALQTIAEMARQNGWRTELAEGEESVDKDDEDLDDEE